jgi:hypothetical protein
MKICQHGVNIETHICKQCETEVAKFRALNAEGARSKERNDKVIALLLEQDKNDRLFGSRWR